MIVSNLVLWICCTVLVISTIPGMSAFSLGRRRNDKRDWRVEHRQAWRETLSRRRRQDVSGNRQLFIKVALIMDETTYQHFNSEIEAVNTFGRNITYIVDKTYRHLDARVVLVTTVTWTSGKLIPFLYDKPSVTLQQFADYSHNNLSLHHKFDIAFLISFSLSSPAVALTNYRSTCRSSRSAVGVLQIPNHVDVNNVAALLSREIGRGIGLLDDTKICKCSSETSRCVMNTSLSSLPAGFSDCSIMSFNAAYTEGGLWCLENYPIELIEPHLCGNGIVEPGEDCDCGNEEDCADNTCCVNCRLVPGAECGGGSCCNDECKLLNAGSLCRHKSGPCDIPEYCTGVDGQCSPNVVVYDGALCDNDMGTCNGGICQTKQRQCVSLWGEDSKIAESSCLGNSTVGTSTVDGDIPTQMTDTTLYGDAECGLLVCDVRRTDLTSLRARSITVSADWTSQHLQCRSISIMLPDGTNIGHVADGTPCGIGGACSKGLCLNRILPRCLGDPAGEVCSGNGICSNSGDCICYCGWAGSQCSVENSTREGVRCIPDLKITDTGDGNGDSGAGGRDGKDKDQVRLLTSAIIGGSVATIFGVAIIFGATSIGFRRARKQNRLRRMHQFKLFSMFQPTKQQQKRLAKFGKGRPHYTPGKLDGAAAQDNHEHDQQFQQHQHHHQPQQHHHHHRHKEKANPGGPKHGNKKKDKKVRLMIDMHTDKPEDNATQQTRTETII